MSLPATGFTRTRRLTKAPEYQNVFDSAHRSVDNSFLLLARVNSLNIARLGLAISKKNLPSSVQRNRIKRLIRESFRLHQQELVGVDVVVLAQKRIIEKENSDLRNSIKAHWGKISKWARS